MEKLEEKYIVWNKEVGKEDVRIAGGKGANLGELLRAGLPVPPFFIVTAKAYRDFIESTHLKEKIEELLSQLNVDDTQALQLTSSRIQELIITTPLPEEIKSAIIEAYKMLGAGGPERYVPMSLKVLDILKLSREIPFVAIRSSATAEDLPSASFAGQQATFLNVRGESEVVEGVQKCWASLFSARAIFYRAKHGFKHMQVEIAVIVQKMVNSEKSGVAFSCDPVTGDLSKIVIEAGFGLGEAIVSGEINPDLYLVDKQSLQILKKEVKEQKILRTRDPYTGKNVTLVVPSEKQNSQKLSDEEIVELAKVIRSIEEYYRFPQDVEWAIEDGKIYIVQTRPVTTLQKVKEMKGKEMEVKGREILKGLPASPGIASGIVRLILDPSQLHRLNPGEVLVTKMTNPDYVPAMRKAAAIITDEGGLTCHAAIVSRELGIPCIVGTGNATALLQDGELVTVDAINGAVYKGIIEVPSERKKMVSLEEVKGLKTKTKIYMNLGVPEKIDEYKDLPFDGIGLMRIEFIIASYIGEHPNYLLEKGEGEKYVNKLAEGIAKVAQAVAPRPVVVRFSDFKTNEYRDLKGGEKYEPQEANPMLGWRGVSRYISNEFENAFRLECKAIRKVREEFKLRNVWVMLPFVRTTWEVEKCIKIMEEEGLKRSEDFQIWLMAEVPSIIFLADEFSKLCDGFSIGSNDLTQLILGADRDSQILGKMGYFDERNAAVLRAMKHLIQVAHQFGKTVSICGQSVSVYPEINEFLVRCGIDSISVNPDAVIEARKHIYEIEEKLAMEKLAAEFRF
ncbi:MAG: phosphoenolpyruvate synthase [Candidatus Nanoarchaeia archaeon]|nr:phosphoenolpyruvate synthase [Candidatus Haiyanarchaeum thermophilum]MCW1302908.1 phosphoenolpyruvate synthase [Candidatus Haiyanarchaeum thermophilum]MCW1303587.1 phosphoenolpyruvate synthase [Candidatus Haiyanarchaeum thermophilum]MCW1306269.1 phosphoenolpyruvate synthase [Candidatus Haiyanarchaeum thermophilum]MCW1307495.1 phosphoenolpyruvate synthase [Candidatus Haiyanarchaeum thermophilum]